MILGVCVLHAPPQHSSVRGVGGSGAAFPLRPFTRTVEPWIPGLPPSTPPMVDSRRRASGGGGGRLEAVFGYHNPDEFSVYVGLDQDTDVADRNVIVRES